MTAINQYTATIYGMSSTNLPPEANWYVDPTNQAQQRWWDGDAWTAMVRIAAAPTIAPFPADQQWPKRCASYSILVFCLVVIGSAWGFWGSITLIVAGIGGAATQIFWVPEWRERRTLEAPHPGAVHESALWWGSGSLWEGNRVSPTHLFLNRKTKQNGTIAIYPGFLVFHGASGITTSVRADETVVAYKTTASLWLYTSEVFATNTPDRSWVLDYQTAEHGLLEALSRSGFRSK